MDERAAFRTIAHAIKRRYYLLVAIVAGLTLVAAVAAIVRQPIYQGTALLFVDQRFNSSQGFDISLQSGQPLSEHIIQSVTSRSVLVLACSGTYFDTPATSRFKCDATALANRVSANTVGSADWVAVNVTAGSAAQAAALADAVARATVDQNQADIDQLLASTRNYLNSELDRLSAEIQAEHATIARLQAASGNESAIVAHQATLKLLEDQHLATYNRIQELAIEETRLVESVKLSQLAVPSLKPVDPDPVRYLAVGLMAGLSVGLLVVLLVDRFDDRLFDTDGLSTAAGTRLVLAVAARDSASLSRRTSNPYAMARTSLLALHPELTKVLVVAASSRDRVRPVAAGLGTAAVKAGQTVLILDTDAPIHVMEQQSSRNGSRMKIVSAPSDGDGRFSDLALADSDGKFDLTVIVTAAPDSHPAAVSLARIGDVAIVVATAGATHFSDVKRTAETLRLGGIEVAGAILAIDSSKDSEAGQDGPRSRRPLSDIAGPQVLEVEPEPLPIAVNQARLPTWRGPGG